MKLTPDQEKVLQGKQGFASQKAMQILVKLGEIYGAQYLLPVTSVQIAGVSYDNLGEAGLHFLQQMADGGGRARVLTTLNPAGMDIENWQALGISPEFADNQKRVLDSFAAMGVITSCTCTPYLIGNTPHYGQHIAWSESSAVCYANSVLGARTNREGGPSALAASLTGFTPAYGYHLDGHRAPTISVQVTTPLSGTYHFGALGRTIADQLPSGKQHIPYISGIPGASIEELKSLSASIGTYAGTALFHMQGITPEAGQYKQPSPRITIGKKDIQAAVKSMNDVDSSQVDFVSLGCPHLSIQEIARIAELLQGKKVTKEFWITTARPTKKIADMMGYTQLIEASGARFATDTCCVVAPIKDRFTALATDSAKACFYAYAKNGFKTMLKPFDQVVEEALK